ncbi:glycosyltransferase family 2 protein [Pontibacter sp. H259]|uniref:glycosyltransferase family 2 protein n=1 Tax=Pontibacter sp. H259 TaxID=3133421 RepID=UPI0030C2EB58
MGTTVSVIIPNFNHQSYLEQRIVTVLNQTYQNFEVILLDDCSSDKSCEIIEKYKSHPKVKHTVLNKINSGSTFNQWEKGIALASGEWIWIAESDDYADKSLLSTLVENTMKDNSIVLSYCQSFEVNETGQILRDMSWWTSDLDCSRWERGFINDGIDEINNSLLYKNTIPNASAVLFKKSIFQNIDKEYKSMKLCGDWFVWVQLLRTGKVAFSSKILNYFRKHSATTRNLNSTFKIKLMIEEELKVLREVEKNIKDKNKLKLQERRNSLLDSYLLYFTKNDALYFIFNYRSKSQYFPIQDLLLKYGSKSLNKLKIFFKKLLRPIIYFS